MHLFSRLVLLQRVMTSGGTLVRASPYSAISCWDKVSQSILRPKLSSCLTISMSLKTVIGGGERTTSTHHKDESKRPKQTDESLDTIQTSIMHLYKAKLAQNVPRKPWRILKQNHQVELKNVIFGKSDPSIHGPSSQSRILCFWSLRGTGARGHFHIFPREELRSSSCLQQGSSALLEMAQENITKYICWLVFFFLWIISVY